MYLEEHELRLWEFWEFRLGKYLLLYVPPILLLIGTFGNILTVVILSRKSMWRQSTYFYLAILAGSDTIVLYVGLPQLWIETLCGKSLRDYSHWTCKIMNVAGYTSSDYSGWLIIAVTIERYLAVCKPLKASSLIGNRERAVKVVLLILVLMFIINMHFFWTVEIVVQHVEDKEIYICEGGPEHSVLITQVWPWVDAVLYSFVPFIVILILNILIIRQVVKARKVRQELQTDGGAIQCYRARVSPNASANSRGAASATTANQCSIRLTKPQTNPRPSTDSSSRITVMLLIISFVFLALTLPMTASNIWLQFILRSPVQDLQTALTFNLVRTITKLVMHLNHCINFFLYCATGHKFRQQLRWILVQSKHKCSTAMSCAKGRTNNRMHYDVGLANMQPDFSVWPPSRTGSMHRPSKHALNLELTALTQAQTDRRTPSPNRDHWIGQKSPAKSPSRLPLHVTY